MVRSCQAKTEGRRPVACLFRFATLPGADDTDLRMTCCAFTDEAGMVRRHSASPSVDRRTVPSRASTTHRVARDRAMVAAHAIATDATDADGGETGGSFVLWVLVRCRSRHQILGADHLLDVHALGAFLARCQYKFGGIGKAPDEHPGEHPCANALPSHLFLASEFSPLACEK
ncbi:hypothetical protein BGW80DRAFT_1327114 [Lactifluus volemus]|nr:hypothetical protein BGW80DRAFT_1327114 [Lactifluus volemus]